MVFTDDSVLHSQWPSENTKASLDHRPWLPNSAGVGVSLSDHPGSGRFTEATPKDMQMPGVEYKPRGACRIQPGRTSSMQSQKVSRGLWKNIVDILPENAQKILGTLHQTDSEVYIAVETPPQFRSCWTKDEAPT